ncbi:hypothetical protein IWX90DRAFT_415516 [Phyllosticta citrichinensis]|uniref:Protein phosphatase 4 core regulatory subunit R2 n=1 Tax=Phyllosticta citrichinensis TaxID=1130410 RepID=A0ABR1XPX5_9PEZI
MLSAEQLLEQAAKDGSMVPEDWPRALRFVLPRLDDIVHNHFPIPTAPAPHPEPARDCSSTPSKPENTGESIATDNENAPPGGGASEEGSGGSQKADGDAQASDDPILPPELHEIYTSIVFNLNKNFPLHPPHTLQRLAELVMSPNAHYRFLPSYLRALDRVVTVSSPTTVFPLPQTTVPSSVSTILNGVTPGSANLSSPSVGSSPSLGSDDSLGGALLTPIPWLRPENDCSGNSGSELVSESTEMVDGPNGTGRIETVSVVNGVLGTTTSAPASTTATSPSPDNASDSPSSPSGTANTNATATAPDALRDTGPITQGELLRQEQEAGIVTVAASGASGSTSSRPVTRSSGLLSASQQPNPDQQSEPHAEGEPVEDAEPPHARGPDVIGMEDMGPQQGGGLARSIDMEAAVGRPAPHPERSGEGSQEGEGEGAKVDEAQGGSREEEMKDADDDVDDAAKPSASSSVVPQEDQQTEQIAPAQAESSDYKDADPASTSTSTSAQPTAEPLGGVSSADDVDDDWEMLPREEETTQFDAMATEEAATSEKEKEQEKKDDVDAVDNEEAVTATAAEAKESKSGSADQSEGSGGGGGGGDEATKAAGESGARRGKRKHGEDDGDGADVEDAQMGGCGVE